MLIFTLEVGVSGGEKLRIVCPTIRPVVGIDKGLGWDEGLGVHG